MTPRPNLIDPATGRPASIATIQRLAGLSATTVQRFERHPRRSSISVGLAYLGALRACGWAGTLEQLIETIEKRDAA